MDLDRDADPIYGVVYSTWLTQALFTVPDSNDIDTIAIQLSHSSLNDLFSSEQYARLDLALTSPALLSLKSVRAKVTGEEINNASMYHKRLPLTSARGILVIEPDVDWVPRRGDPECDCRKKTGLSNWR